MKATGTCWSARRAEIFFTPNEDGTASTEGKVVWHTEWWHYIGNVKRAESLGPVIENSIAQVLGGQLRRGGGRPIACGGHSGRHQGGVYAPGCGPFWD